jgi:hypothetical protein
MFFIFLLLLVEGCSADVNTMFDAMGTSCTHDNWGMPLQRPQLKDRDYYDNVIMEPCSRQFSVNSAPFSDSYPQATAIHSLSTDEYDSFHSIDLIPENRYKYSPSSPWGNPKTYDFKTATPKAVLSAECRLPVTDGSSWDITRIGPFRTTGGYDWLQIGWDNIWNISEKLKLYPEGLFLLEQVMQPVTEDGTRLNNPPIHIHHMHIGPAPYVRQRFSHFQCAMFSKSCFTPDRRLETHGDYNCDSKDGGMDCKIEMFPAG